MVLTTYRGRTGMEPFTPAANIYDFLEWAGLERGSTVLDLGCGNGRNSAVMQEKGLSPFGVDLSEEALGEARDYMISRGVPVNHFLHGPDNLKFRDGVKLLRADMEHLPFKYGSIDAIYANTIPSQETAGKWKDSLRALKKGGKAYVNMIQKAEVINFGFGKYSFEVPQEEIESWFGKGSPEYRMEFIRSEQIPTFKEINGNKVYQFVTNLLVKVEKL
jgi:SAM-dependent methyltransferase